MTEPTEADKICNRHLARLLDNLEQAQCPVVYLQAVKAEMSWLRTDIKELQEKLHEARN